MSRLGSAKKFTYQRLHALSLTKRLVAVVVLMVLVAYLITTSLTTFLLRDYLTDRVDVELEQYLAPLGNAAYNQSAFGGGSSLTYNLPNTYVGLYTPVGGGSQIAIEQNSQLDRPDLTGILPDDERIGQSPFTMVTDGGDRWRVVGAEVQTNTAQASSTVGTIVIALPLNSVDRTVAQLWVLTILTGFATLMAVALLSWIAVRRAFRPLTRIEDTAAAIAAGDLTRRIDESQANDEVASLSNSLNAMLANLERAFTVRKESESRMRQFLADASHELRTPLATVRGYAELYRVGGVTKPEDVAGAMQRIESEATRMTSLVEDLLTLTRWDTGPELPNEPVDLNVLVSDVVQDARVRTPDREVRMEPLSTGGGQPLVNGDDGALRQVLTNLVANAIAHTDPGTPVEVAVGVQNGRCVVEVIDHGEGLTPETAERVFERFFRADPARSRGNGGTGLGLAIVASIMGRHNGTVRHIPTSNGGATFRIELPAAQRKPASLAAALRSPR
ncbi:HAMP domain-containing histidine kinase [Ornithinimicrobium sp. Arc0846-15]|nr:HAMP domain-containing histidine kinase [Ornithinimicrobium laminariae]